LVKPNESELISSGTDPTGTYEYFDNAITLPYQIANRYNIRNQNNQIKL
jgi:hypothetical protein